MTLEPRKFLFENFPEKSEFCTQAFHGTGGGGCSPSSSSSRSEVDMTLPSLLPLSTDDEFKESCERLRSKGGQVLELPGESGVGESKRWGADDDADDPNMNCIARLLADSTSSFACLNCHKGNADVKELQYHQMQEKRKGDLRSLSLQMDTHFILSRNPTKLQIDYDNFRNSQIGKFRNFGKHHTTTFHTITQIRAIIEGKHTAIPGRLCYLAVIQYQRY